MKKVLFLFAVLLTGVISMTSCSKMDGPESYLVGVWKQHSVEYQFAAHSIDTRIEENVVFTFREDGTCTVQNGEGTEDAEYAVDGNILYVGTDDVYILSLNEEEMVLSGGYSLMHIYGGTDNFKKFTTFKGIQIYLDNYEEYCYQKGQEWYSCKRLDEGAHADPAGAVFYDCTLGHFSRVE